MTPTQLHVFLTVVESGSFSRAASLLGQTRPGITASIKVLESEFGGPLLTRSIGDIGLTLLGQEVLVHAGAISKEYAQLRHITKIRSVASDGVLRIASPASLCCWPLPRLLGAFQRRRPEASVKIVEAQVSDFSPMLAQRLADVALSTVPVLHWSWSLLFREPFSALFRCDTRVRLDGISILQLSNVPIIITEADTDSLVESAFRQAGSILKRAHPASTYSVAFAMVQEGLGVSLLPESVARLAPATLRPVPINDGPSRVVGLIHSMKPTMLAQDFVDEAGQSVVSIS